MNKKVTCYLCGSDDLHLILDEVRFGKRADVYKCHSCSLTFLDQDSFDFPEDFYEKEYHQTYITHVEPDAFDPQAYYEKMKKTIKIWAGKFNEMLTGQETVLDLGCSTGHFIESVKSRTKRIFGYDLNQKEVDYCKNILNLEVSNSPMEKRFKPSTFDYITMIYVLEHIACPEEFLVSLKKYLKPGGKFIILVPNVQDALINFYDIPEFKKFYYCIEHLFYYTPETIKQLFERAGLDSEINVIQEYPVTNHLNWGYTHKPSDALMSRLGVPDIPLINEAQVEGWAELWSEFNRLYQGFLKKNKFGDRIWCVVSAK